jgi:diguanylate cyclase (GGDEF)-like protein/PAS domain S-box-containing protein
MPRLTLRGCRECAAVLAVCLGLIAFLWAFTLERIRYEREQAVAATVLHNSNLALALEEQTTRALKAAEQILLFMRHEIQEDDQIVTLEKLTREGLAEGHIFAASFILDARGRVLTPEGKPGATSLADRDFFRFHRERPGGTIHIGEPVLGRVTGRAVIPVSLRRSAADGSFAGVYVVGIDAAYFLSSYQRFDIGRDGLVQLVSLEGIALARRAGERSTFGNDMRESSILRHARLAPSGNFVSAGRLEQTPRFSSFRRLADYPLVVGVGTSSREALAPFAERQWRYWLLAAGATLVLLAFAAALGAALRRRQGTIRELAASEERHRATFEQSAVGIVHASLDGRLLRVNAKFCAITGYDAAELSGRSIGDLTHAEDRELTADAMRRLTLAPQGGAPEYEKRYVRRDGSLRWASVAVSLVRKPDGAPDYAIAVVTDISARKRFEDLVAYQANFDKLTGLPNRSLFSDRLTQTLGQARRHGWTAGVVMLDLDRFQAVNDTLGHQTGDRLLQEVAGRLQRCVRAGDTVARVGGDGFAVVAADLDRPQDAGIVAQKIIDAIAPPFAIDGQEIFVGASAGIAAFPADGEDAATLIRNADTAMSRAKHLGRNNHQFYAAAMNARAVEKLRIETDLRHALARNELRLHLQPKASLATGSIVGFEALLRWQRPGNGLVPPAEFIPALEETGLIVPVGEWVIGAACAQLAEWRRAGLEPLPVAVNLAAKQFTRGDLAATVEAALTEHGVPARLLELEVTESDAMQNPEAAMAALRKAKQLGVQVSIDDFGTGYSSLAYLKRFPIDTLKLDHSFVAGLPRDADDVSIACAVITMAHSLGLQVVAEGVETAEQRDFLRERGCDQMQGYLLSRPVPPAEAARLLAPAGAAERAAA